MNQIETKEAVPRDIDGIIDLMHRMFGSDIIDKTIYGAHGIKTYLRDQFEVPLRKASNRYFVAKSGRQVVGYLEILRKRPILSVNYICSDQSLGVRGIGSSLLLESLKDLDVGQYTRVELDVFGDNEAAIRWYAKMGFSKKSVAYWYAIDNKPITSLRNDLDVVVSEYPQAKAVYEKYGFSKLSLSTETSDYTIGMLGEKYYRTNDPSILMDEDALNYLSYLHYGKKILLVLNEKIENFPRTEFLKTSFKMHVHSRSLLEHLSATHQP